MDDRYKLCLERFYSTSTPKLLEDCSLVHKSFSDKAISPPSNLLFGDIESQSIIKKICRHPLPQLKKPELYDKTCGRIRTTEKC